VEANAKSGENMGFLRQIGFGPTDGSERITESSDGTRAPVAENDHHIWRPVVTWQGQKPILRRMLGMTSVHFLEYREERFLMVRDGPNIRVSAPHYVAEAREIA
jgi:hypothetical protein